MARTGWGYFTATGLVLALLSLLVAGLGTIGYVVWACGGLTPGSNPSLVFALPVLVAAAALFALGAAILKRLGVQVFAEPADRRLLSLGDHPLLSLLEGLFCAALLAWGLWTLGLYAFARTRGTTAEEQLTLAEGVPSDVIISESRDGTKQYLTFTVAGYRTEYASDAPRFQEVLAAVGRGETLQVWVSTQQETLLRRRSWVPLYMVSAEGEPVLSYAEVVSHREKGRQLLLGGGALVSAIGTWGIYRFLRRTRRDTHS